MLKFLVKLDEESFFKKSFEDYIDSLKPKNPEEEFAIRALKILCHKPEDYGLTSSSKIVLGVYCMDEKDRSFYIKYFARMLAPFKPLWNNCNDSDFLKKLGIVFIKRKEEVLGYNLKGILVSRKWLYYLEKSIYDYKTPWKDMLGYLEERMRCRFLDDYFILMGSEIEACIWDYDAHPRVIDLDTYICDWVCGK